MFKGKGMCYASSPCVSLCLSLRLSQLGIENTALTAKPGSLPLDNPLGSASSLQSEEEKEMSSLTEAIHRVEGSALAILKMLRDGKGDLTGIEEEATTSDKGDLEGDLVVVKTGCSTIVSSTVGNGDSIMSEIAAAGGEGGW